MKKEKKERIFASSKEGKTKGRREKISRCLARVHSSRREDAASPFSSEQRPFIGRERENEQRKSNYTGRTLAVLLLETFLRIYHQRCHRSPREHGRGRCMSTTISRWENTYLPRSFLRSISSVARDGFLVTSPLGIHLRLPCPMRISVITKKIINALSRTTKRISERSV